MAKIVKLKDRESNNILPITRSTVVEMNEGISVEEKFENIEQTLRSLANLASLKPELGGEHSGFAVFDALMGRVTSLKTNYGIDNEKLYKFQKTLSRKK